MRKNKMTDSREHQEPSRTIIRWLVAGAFDILLHLIQCSAAAHFKDVERNSRAIQVGTG